MMRMFAIALLVFALAGAGCSREMTDTEAQALVAKMQDAHVVRSEPAHPYPRATAVRIFVAKPYVSGQRYAEFEDPAGRLLSSPERAAFEARLKLDTWSADYPRAACFIPHHFFRYYDAAGKQVGEIAVCFCCAQIAAEPQLPQEGTLTGGRLRELGMDRAALKAFIETLGYRTDIDCPKEPAAS